MPSKFGHCRTENSGKTTQPISSAAFFMDIALSIAAFLFSITGIVGCIVPIIPGVALSYAGLLCAFFAAIPKYRPRHFGSGWP